MEGRGFGDLFHFNGGECYDWNVGVKDANLPVFFLLQSG
jgi:hypothetical protein